MTFHEKWRFTHRIPHEPADDEADDHEKPGQDEKQPDADAVGQATGVPQQEAKHPERDEDHGEEAHLQPFVVKERVIGDLHVLAEPFQSRGVVLFGHLNVNEWKIFC